MAQGSRAIFGSVQVILGQLAQQLLLLVRNIVVARLLPADQYGIALTFVVVVSAIDAISDFGIEVYLIRSSDTEVTSLQRVLQGILAFRGLIAGGALIGIAQPLALMFGTPEASWAYMALGFLTFLRGFTHLDPKRAERDLNFWPITMSNVIAVALGSAVAIASAILIRSYASMLYGYAAQFFVFVVLSHVFSNTKYRISIEWEQIKLVLKYGWPLIINNVIFYFVTQGDRAVVGAVLGMNELALYGVMAIIPNAVSLVVLRFSAALYIPLLARQRYDREKLCARYDSFGALSALIAIYIFVFFALFGDSTVSMLFGSQYAVSGFLIMLLGAQSSFRTLRGLQQTLFLCEARTGFSLFCNTSSIVGIIVVATYLPSWPSLAFVVTSVCIAECFSAGVSIIFAGRVLGKNSQFRAVLYLSALTAFILAFVSGAALWRIPNDILDRLIIAASVLAVATVLIVSLSPFKREMQRSVRTVWSQWRRLRGR